MAYPEKSRSILHTQHVETVEESRGVHIESKRQRERNRERETEGLRITQESTLSRTDISRRVTKIEAHTQISLRAYNISLQPRNSHGRQLTAQPLNKLVAKVVFVMIMGACARRLLVTSQSSRLHCEHLSSRFVGN